MEGAKAVELMSGGVHKEDKYFKRENNLVEEFSGNAPIVYEADMRTIVKQNQYGYEREQTLAEIEEYKEELLADDVDLVAGIDVTTLSTTNRANYSTSKEDFEARWKDIKRQARQEKPENEIDGETDYIDGIIKE